MNFLRYGNRAINLDLVRRIEFIEKSTGQPRDGVLFEMIDGKPFYAYDADALAIIPLLKRICRHGETDMPGIPANLLTELDAAVGHCHRLAAVARDDTGSPDHERLALELAARLERLIPLVPSY